MRTLVTVFLLSVGSVFAAIALAEAPPIFILKWGTSGSGDGQFYNPLGVAVDASGDIYVADTFNDRIQKFGPAGVQAEAATWGRVKAERR